MKNSTPETGARIDAERRAMGYTIKEFSQLVGISDRHYRRIHLGADISDELLLKFCAATNRDPNFFLLAPEGNPFSSGHIDPTLLKRLFALPPWAFRTVVATLRELENICRANK